MPPPMGSATSFLYGTRSDLDLLGENRVAGDGSLGLGQVCGEVALERLLACFRADREPTPVVVARSLRFDERRLLLVATLLSVWAPRREFAPWGRGHEIRRTAADDLEATVARLIELGDRLEQAFGVRHPHLREQRLRRRLLHDLAGV